MLSIAAVILWVYIAQCKRDKITRVCLLLRLELQKITQKHTPSINYVFILKTHVTTVLSISTVS